MCLPTLAEGVYASAGLAGAVSRTATAPVDRVKLLLQVQDSGTALTVRDGWNRMVSEGGSLPLSRPLKTRAPLCDLE